MGFNIDRQQSGETGVATTSVAMTIALGTDDKGLEKRSGDGKIQEIFLSKMKRS